MKDVLQQARECGAFVVLDEKGTAYHALMDERELSAFRDSVLEEAATRCEAEGEGLGMAFGEHCAAAIRSMKGKPT